MSILLFLVVSLVNFLLSASASPNPSSNITKQCKCIYGDSCWPSPDDFSLLSKHLSQPFLHPVPPPSSCYPSSPVFQYASNTSCYEVTAQYTNGTWRASQPGAMENPNFESEYAFVSLPNGTRTLAVHACFINTSIGVPCEQGSVPPIGVDARNVRDVQAAVVFAKEHYLRLVVKNTGHDYIGRSAGMGGFMVWTHNMKRMTYDAAFVPEGSPENSTETFSAVTLGAGVQWSEAYKFVDGHGRFMIGGVSLGGSVGSAGGWIMGGGHSAFSPSFGLGVDNVLQFSIVLSSGAHITTNAYKHPDLFWALRGGGGGTYGIVTSVTYKTYPVFPIAASFLKADFTTINSAANMTTATNGRSGVTNTTAHEEGIFHPEASAQAQATLTQFIKIHPLLSDAGWGGYGSFSNTSLILALFSPLPFTASKANETFHDFVSFANTTTGGTGIEASFLTFPSFFSFSNLAFANKSGEVGVQSYVSSRLLSRDIALKNPEGVAKIMLAIDGGVSINAVAGGAVSKVSPSSMGLNPSWRSSLSEVYIDVTWAESPSPSILQFGDALIQRTALLNALSSDSAAYLNEASPFETDPHKSFFGTNYAKLEEVKGKYDPEDLFIVREGVGSERWDPEVRCRI